MNYSKLLANPVELREFARRRQQEQLQAEFNSLFSLEHPRHPGPKPSKLSVVDRTIYTRDIDNLIGELKALRNLPNLSFYYSEDGIEVTYKEDNEYEIEKWNRDLLNYEIKISKNNQLFLLWAKSQKDILIERYTHEANDLQNKYNRAMQAVPKRDDDRAQASFQHAKDKLEVEARIREYLLETWHTNPDNLFRLAR